MESDSSKHHMTKDVTIEILSNLPVKSLMRFKCVCKYWKTVMNSDDFVKKHTCHSPSRLAVQHYNDSTKSYGFAIFFDETLSCMPLEYHDLDNLQMPYYQDIIGPFDGIIGFYDGTNRDRDRIALWNPATKEFKVLPVPYPNNLSIHFRPFIHIFGIGLDIVTNSYKLVCIRRFWDEKEDNPYTPRVVAVHNLSTNCWRVFEANLIPDRCVDGSLCNTYWRGVYYWITSNNEREYMILSFDMSKETFQETQGPPHIPPTHWGDITIYGDSIAMIFRNPWEVETIFDIWVMKEDGGWSKELTVGPLLEVEKPLGIWKNGELFILTNSSDLILYDYKTQETKHLGVHGDKSCFRVFTYKESLVSIMGENECQQSDNSNFHTREPNVNMVRVEDFIASL